MRTPEFGRLRQMYSQSSNEELLRLAGERESLTAPAQDALRLEIEKRGLERQYLSSEPPPSVPESTTKTKAKMFTWIWPAITDEQEAKKAAKSGAYGAVFVAICTGVLSLIAIATGDSFAGIDGYGLVDAFLFGIIAWRIFRFSFPWAVFGLLIYLAEAFLNHDGQESIGAVSVIITLSLIASVRGTAFLNKARNCDGIRRFGIEAVSVPIICVALIAAIAYRIERSDEDNRAKKIMDALHSEETQKDFSFLVKDYEAKDWDGFRDEILSRERYLVDLKEQDQYIRLRLHKEQNGSDNCGQLELDKGEPALQGVITTHEGLVSFAKDNTVLTEDSEPVLRSLLTRDDNAWQRWNHYLADMRKQGCNN